MTGVSDLRREVGIDVNRLPRPRRGERFNGGGQPLLIDSDSHPASVAHQHPSQDSTRPTTAYPGGLTTDRRPGLPNPSPIRRQLHPPVSTATLTAPISYPASCQTRWMAEPAQHEVLIDIDRGLVSACADLFIETFNAAPWHDGWTHSSATSRLTDMIETPGFRGVALTANGTITGAALGQVEQWFSGRHFYLREMFVRADLQRQGRGARLLHGIHRGDELEASYLITDHGTPAHEFYQHHGYAAARSRIVMTRRH